MYFQKSHDSKSHKRTKWIENSSKIPKLCTFVVWVLVLVLACTNYGNKSHSVSFYLYSVSTTKVFVTLVFLSHLPIDSSHGQILFSTTQYFNNVFKVPVELQHKHLFNESVRFSSGLKGHQSRSLWKNKKLCKCTLSGEVESKCRLWENLILDT